MGVKHEYSVPKTPQQNRVAKRKNRTLFDMATSMLTSKELAKRFWVEAVTSHAMSPNVFIIHLELTTQPMKYGMEKKPTIKYFKVFDNTCYILRDNEHLRKFDKNSDEVIFLRYSTTSRAYRVYNKRNLTIEESINVVVDNHESTQVQIELPIVFSDHEVKRPHLIKRLMNLKNGKKSSHLNRALRMKLKKSKLVLRRKDSQKDYHIMTS